MILTIILRIVTGVFNILSGILSPVWNIFDVLPIAEMIDALAQFAALFVPSFAVLKFFIIPILFNSFLILLVFRFVGVPLIQFSLFIYRLLKP